MVTFRSNNNRRPPYRGSNNRRSSFRRNNDEGSKFSNNDNFQRKAPGRNNHNASKLIEKYNDLAREASSNGDKILSENYLQHADHFTRILNEQEIVRKAKFNQNNTSIVESSKIEVKQDDEGYSERNTYKDKETSETKKSIKS